MLSPITYLKRPEYLLRPAQACRRLQRLWRKMAPTETVVVPWGAQFIVQTGEKIGLDLYLYGIFDKIVPEAIARLVDPGEWAVDVGANIGQNSSLMAVKVGPTGAVWAFEPHPETFKELQQNARQWSGLKLGKLQLENVALGDHYGEAWLANSVESKTTADSISPGCSWERGSAAIAPGYDSSKPGFKVPLRRLDEYLSPPAEVGVCKIDVEGHELAVLSGAEGTLSRKAIRDIIFEDFNPQPSPVTQLLERHGYHVFELADSWVKPRLRPVKNAHGKAPDFSFNFLGTRDPSRAVRRFRAPGWFC